MLALSYHDNTGPKKKAVLSGENDRTAERLRRG